MSTARSAHRHTDRHIDTELLLLLLLLLLMLLLLLLLLPLLLGLATWRFESPTPIKGTKVADLQRDVWCATHRGARICRRDDRDEGRARRILGGFCYFLT